MTTNSPNARAVAIPATTYTTRQTSGARQTASATTLEEAEEGESLDEKLSAEVPDVEADFQ